MVNLTDSSQEAREAAALEGSEPSEYASLVSPDVTRKCYHAAPCGICLKPDVSSGRVFDLTEGQIKARPVLIQRVRNLDQAGS